MLILFIISCVKDVRCINEDSILQENEGVLIFKLEHPFDHILSTIDYNIEGFDVSKQEMPFLSRFWLHTTKGTGVLYKLILPAGKYRFESIKAMTADPRISISAGQRINQVMSFPGFSFFVVKKAVNYLGTIYLKET